MVFLGRRYIQTGHQFLNVGFEILQLLFRPLVGLLFDVFVVGGLLLLVDLVGRLGDLLVLIPTALVLAFADLHLLVVVLERRKILVLGVQVFVVVLGVPGRLRLRVAAHDVVPAVLDFRGWSRPSLDRSACWLILGATQIFTGVSFLGTARRRIIVICRPHR